MARPIKWRKVCCLPESNRFGPLNLQANDENHVRMSVDEYETIRLIDLENMTQEECAGRMNIARTTVQGIYNDARRKVAESLVNGKVLWIEGGEYELCDGLGEPCGQRGCHKRRCGRDFLEKEQTVMDQIVIIGTDPPCPRCGLLRKVIEAKVQEMKLEATVQHYAYTSSEAYAFAKANGLTAGTAKDVSKLANIDLDAEAISKVAENFKPDRESEYYPYNDCEWSIELDDLLRSCEKEARNVGIMMTPVLIINGSIKHQGSVPRLFQIEEWLLELKQKKGEKL